MQITKRKSILRGIFEKGEIMNRKQWLILMKSGKHNPELIEILEQMKSKTLKERILKELRISDPFKEYSTAVIEFGRWLVEEAPEKGKLSTFERFAADSATFHMSSCGVPVDIFKTQKKDSLQENMRVLMKHSRKREYRQKAQLAEMYNAFWKKYSNYK